MLCEMSELLCYTFLRVMSHEFLSFKLGGYKEWKF